MKKNLFVIISFGLLVAVLPIHAQNFGNLGFEGANPVQAGDPYPNFYVTAASAFPEWTVTINGVIQPLVTLNSPSAGSPLVSLVSMPVQFVPSGPIDGGYSVLLQGTGSFNAAISQTGLIPVGTKSVLFDAVSENRVGPLNLFVGNQPVSVFVVGNGLDYTIYGADLSAWADQTEQLTISAASGFWLVDDISFSTTVVTPEPEVVTLIALGGLVCGWKRMRGVFLRSNETNHR